MWIDACNIKKHDYYILVQSKKLSQKVQFFHLLAFEIIIPKGTFELGKEIAIGSNFAT
jgi:hypothetical protein